jgi:hypothetical protein
VDLSEPVTSFQQLVEAFPSRVEGQNLSIVHLRPHQLPDNVFRDERRPEKPKKVKKSKKGSAAVPPTTAAAAVATTTTTTTADGNSITTTVAAIITTDNANDHTQVDLGDPTKAIPPLSDGQPQPPLARILSAGASPRAAAAGPIRPTTPTSLKRESEGIFKNESPFVAQTKREESNTFTKPEANGHHSHHIRTNSNGGSVAPIAVKLNGTTRTDIAVRTTTTTTTTTTTASSIPSTTTTTTIAAASSTTAVPPLPRVRLAPGGIVAPVSPVGNTTIGQKRSAASLSSPLPINTSSSSSSSSNIDTSKRHRVAQSSFEDSFMPTPQSPLHTVDSPPSMSPPTSVSTMNSPPFGSMASTTTSNIPSLSSTGGPPSHQRNGSIGTTIMNHLPSITAATAAAVNAPHLTNAPPAPPQHILPLQFGPPPVQHRGHHQHHHHHHQPVITGGLSWGPPATRRQ